MTKFTPYTTTKVGDYWHVIDLSDMANQKHVHTAKSHKLAVNWINRQHAAQKAASN